MAASKKYLNKILKNMESLTPEQLAQVADLTCRRLLFDEAMGKMSNDPAILRECQAISNVFLLSEEDGFQK